jgi:hypothetical protein
MFGNNAHNLFSGVQKSARLKGKVLATPAGLGSASTSMTIPRTIRRMVFTANDVTKAVLF